MIRAFAYIDATTGELLNLQFPQGDPPAEEINDAGLRVVIITDENLPEESCLDYHYFIQNYVYDSSSSTFFLVQKGRRILLTNAVTTCLTFENWFVTIEGKHR